MLCFDIRHMTAINDVSRKAGDLAILEEASRIDAAAGEEMLVLRIGGDEFALVAGLYDRAAAEALAQKVLAQNGRPIAFEGRTFPLRLWCGVTQIPEHLRYDSFFAQMHRAIDESKG